MSQRPASEAAAPARRRLLGLAAAGLGSPWWTGCAAPAVVRAEGPGSRAETGPRETLPPAASASTAPSPAASDQSADTPPPIAREFRAAWVATVAHIDWPSRRGLGAAQQRAEMLELLDKKLQ